MQDRHLVDWRTTAQIAEHLEVTPQTVRAWVRDGMPAHRAPGGRLLRFDPVEVDQWMRSRQSSGAAA